MLQLVKMGSKGRRFLCAFLLSVGIAQAAWGEFEPKWDRVERLAQPQSTVQVVRAVLTPKGYTCCIPVPKYSSCTLWTTNLEGNAYVTLDTSASRDEGIWHEVVTVMAAFAVESDTDGNLLMQEGIYQNGGLVRKYRYPRPVAIRLISKDVD